MMNRIVDQQAFILPALILLWGLAAVLIAAAT